MIRVWLTHHETGKQGLVPSQLVVDFIKARLGQGLVVTSYDIEGMIKKQWGLVIDHHDTGAILDNLAHNDNGLVSLVSSGTYPKYRIS